MKNFIENNKKPLIVICSALIVFLCIAIFSVVSSGSKQEASNDDDPGVFDYKYNVFKLGDFTQTSTTECPIMYDFLYGSNGINSDIVNPVKDTCYIICTKDASSTIYVSYLYSPDTMKIEGQLTHYSSKPKRYSFKNDGSRKSFYSSLDSDNTVKKFSEAGYDFYVISSIDEYDFYGVDLHSLRIESEESYAQRMLSNGNGYPTADVRKKCDLNSIYSEFKIDFNSTFWDKYNYDQDITFTSDNGSDIIYRVKGEDEYHYIKDGRDSGMIITAEQLEFIKNHQANQN